ncbi:MAG: DUF502 domain-containing protein [candidate division KSB1 bacterium]|nr:DUF502 domain-containing protein [candidate division KSB1 bacterium]MDZ7341647.1 DUF502 domain-containing protein [candidate division KSB1 bacterium]
MPIIATILALKFLLQSIDGMVGTLPERLFGYHIPGIGILVTVLVVLAMGVFASNYFGKKILEITDKFFAKIPLVNLIYSAAKEFMQAVALPNRITFKEVVLLEYPRKGCYAYGFVTSHIERRSDTGSERLVNVFIPTTPVATTGFMIAFPENEVTPMNISVEKALKMIVSGGIVAPKTIAEKAPKNA